MVDRRAFLTGLGVVASGLVVATRPAGRGKPPPHKTTTTTLPATTTTTLAPTTTTLGPTTTTAAGVCAYSDSYADYCGRAA